MPGRAYTTLFGLASDRYGFVTQDDAIEAGHSPQALDAMVRRGVAERVSWGLYRFTAMPSGPLDQLMEATLWPRPAHGVLSHETALDLYDLCDILPAKVHITVPQGFRTRRKIPGLYVLHARDLAPGDLSSHEGIAIVAPERAIRDCIEVGVRSDLLRHAVIAARGRGLVRAEQAGELERLLAERDR